MICFQIVFFDRLFTEENVTRLHDMVVICFQIVFFDRLFTEAKV